VWYKPVIDFYFKASLSYVARPCLNFLKLKDQYLNLKSLFFFFPSTGVWIQGLILVHRHSTTWVTPSALFCVGYFQDRVLGTICLGWPITWIFLISASWLARITGMSHRAWIFIWLVWIFETGSHSVAQDGLKLKIFLSQPPEYWDYISMPPYSAKFGIFWDRTNLSCY
jgi:hypothetical protein